MSKGDYQSIIESCWDVMSYGIFNIRPNQDPDDPFQTLLTIYNRYFTHFIFDYDRHEAIPGSLQDLLKEFGQPNSLKAPIWDNSPRKSLKVKPLTLDLQDGGYVVYRALPLSYMEIASCQILEEFCLKVKLIGIP